MSAPSQTDRLNTALAGRYRIERHLGEGGMASVYLCEDLKHDRKVALKLLKPELAAVLGAERFVQEIKTTASLQHPHILPLFDSGTADGFLFYVMPWIQGETLRDKLNRETQLGVEESVRITREVADALDYAHRHGVIHRDIKPENILLHDGRPMVADFGIALAVSAAAGGRMTETGLSLGTPHYMSPEQATAEKDITARSDIYSLGSVLYEMLAGNPPHTGATAQQIIMKIIAEPVEPVTKYRKSVPPNVAAALAKALEKLPADRFESARAFADALGNPAYTNQTGTGAATYELRTVELRFLWPLIAASLLALAGFAGWARSALRPKPSSATRVRFTVVVPDSNRIRVEVPGQNFTISPDGSQIVYLGGAGTEHLYLRALNELDARPIPGTELARQVKFSPDGKSLAFVQSGKLRRMPVSGGPATTIADSVVHFSWGDGDVVVFTRGGDLWRVDAVGGIPSLVARHDTSKHQTALGWPFFLPGGKAVLLDIVTGNDQINAQLAVVRLDDGKVTPLGLGGRNPRYVTTGQLLFGQIGGNVVAVPFDALALRTTGTAVTALQDVFIRGGGASLYGVSGSGTLFYVQRSADGELLLVDSTGATRALVSATRDYRWPRHSPTSGRIVFEMAEHTSFGKTDIWVYNDLTRTVARLTNDGNSKFPYWMSDGERVVWITRDSSGVRVLRQRWDGTGAPETLIAGDSAIKYVVPSPAGNRWGVVKYGAFDDLYMAEGDPPSTPQPLVITAAGEGGPSFSPDGRWVAYFGGGTGQNEVYVVAANGDGGRHQVSIDGGAEPVWSPDGKKVFYRAGGYVMAAAITTSPAFSVTSREALFADRFHTSGNEAAFDVSRDGKNFLVVGNLGRASERFIVVTGWLDELKERMAQAGKK